VLPRSAALAAAATPAPRAPVEDARPRVLSSKEDVAALLARKRGVSLAGGAGLSSAFGGGGGGGGTPGGALQPDDAPTPAPALKRPGLVGATPRSGAGSEKRPLIKRPIRTPATGDANKRSKLGGGEGDRVSRMWDKVLKPGEAGPAGVPLGAAGAAQLVPLPAADAHTRRVFVSDLPPSADVTELRNVRLCACAGPARASFSCAAWACARTHKRHA
jgi:hypothetical protein